ncbi:hypothetical protein NQ317_013013 [Molorchus minor]|uniref:CUB domain-containing protein n=1 Tax=Molorchus minor TaxID=1323400 RepID=A0ABQ9K5K9_9CUCU|nr:hypothetical protein NQ317_013013 [Molorchus minor]
MARYTLVLIYAINFSFKYYVQCQSSDICDKIEGKRFYLEYGDSGALHADFQNNLWYSRNSNISNNRCTIEYVTCPSCVIEINFRYLNISRNCGRASVFDTCGCDYVWIYEPAIEDATGEQFCGRFIHTNTSQLGYISQTRIVAISFIYNSRYGHAFSLDYHAKRNRVQLTGHPVLNNMNNISQAIQSPFFPHMYPRDMSVEYIINCKSADMCRISLIFTDFLLAESSILEFFDWNGLRMYVIAGNIFRPPIIISTGPSMVIRFYANGASGLGFKASYSFILGNLDDATFKPNIGKPFQQVSIV